ncbi:MAG: hypothetical protein ACTHJQ_11655 [Rhizobiaceae bacterium]
MPTLDVIDLAPLAVDIAKAMVAGFPGEKVQAAIDMLARDGVVMPRRRSTRPGPAGSSSRSLISSTTIF